MRSSRASSGSSRRGPRGRPSPSPSCSAATWGFGGKVVIDDDRITVTAIDDTPQVHAVIKRANASLARVYASLGTPTPAIDRYPNGNVRFTGFHLHGEMHGAWTFYRSDGSVMRSGSFDRGRQVGTWTTFSRDGRSSRRPSSATRRTDASGEGRGTTHQGVDVDGCH